MISSLPHWRVAGAAAVFVLAGTSAVALAMHEKPSGAIEYGAAMPAPGRPPAAARRTAKALAGQRIMSEAVAACRRTTFSGVQIARWQGPGGSRVSTADLWHRPGGQIVVQFLTGPGSAPAEDGLSPGPTASMAISAEQLALLQSDYVLDYAGHGSAGGRSAQVVAVERADGTLAAKYWLDEQTKLPLRRQLFDLSARVVSDISLTNLRTGPAALGGMPAPEAQPWTQQLGRIAVDELRSQGWPLPDRLPGGLALFSASETSTPAGPVIGLSYSDGLSVVSLFLQRGQLASALAGWRHIAIDGRAAYAIDPDEQTITWSADGYVFTVLADAPQTMVNQAIAALPNGSPPGFWARLSQGFRRLATWANPFR